MSLEIKKFINPRNPLFQFSIFLLLFAAISTLDLYIGTSDFNEKIIIGRNIIVVGLLGSIFYYISRFRLGFTTVNPLNIFVTSLLVYLLVHPTNPWWYLIIIFAGIFLGKYFFKINSQPIFNPAAFGLFVALYVTKLLTAFKLAPESLLISWWGADMRQNFLEAMPLINILVAAGLLLLCIYFTRSFNKLRYAVTFFLTYIVCYFSFTLLGKNQLAPTARLVSQALFDSTIFLALVMIPEPKTSPSLPREHIFVGVISGALFFLSINALGRYIAEPFITTILAANIITLFIKQKKLFR